MDARTHFYPFSRAVSALPSPLPTAPTLPSHTPHRYLSTPVLSPLPRLQEKYPRQLYVDFKKLKVATLRKYAEVFDVSVRPELSTAEMSIAVAK